MLTKRKLLTNNRQLKMNQNDGKTSSQYSGEHQIKYYALI